MKTFDNAWSWIEGLRNGKWMPLYCFRAADEIRLKNTFRLIEREHARGGTMQDNLQVYSKFRIHRAGELMDIEWSLDDIKQDIGTDNLLRILSNFNSVECGAIRASTGERCRKPMFHDGKHSPKKAS